MKINSHIAVIILITASLFAVIIPMQSVYAVITFSTRINLSNDNLQSSVPQIALSGGNNLYAIWSQSVQTVPIIIDDVFFTKSTSSSLDAFDIPINLSNGILGFAKEQQIAASGDNVYVVWRNDTAPISDIFFKRSTDNGVTFSSGINLSTTTGTAAFTPQIATSGNNVYIVWRDAASPDIFFANSADKGATFDPDGPFNLSLGGPISATLPQIVTSGSNVYIVWRDGGSAATDDIFFRASTDNGNTFVPPFSSPAKNLSMGPPSKTATNPQIATSGKNVYVVWRDNRVGNFEIFFANSTDNGATFDPDGPFNLSNTAGVSGTSTASALIEASGNNVYAVWEEGPTFLKEIFFKASTDGSATFGSVINLSDNSGNSQAPQITSFDKNVYVVWQDLTIDPKGDISLQSSSDNGATFSGFTNLSGNAGTSQAVQTVASVNGVNVVWQDDTDSDFDVLFRTGTTPVVLPPVIVFNATEYKLSSTATITVTDQNSNLLSGAIETIKVNVISTAAPAGILLELTETGLNTGVFTGSLTFTSDTSSGSVLKAATGNTITAKFGGQIRDASIFSRTVNFDFVVYDRGSIAHITVTDQNSNLLSGMRETIEVNVTSTEYPSGIPLSLTETDVNTGIFGGAADNNLIFMEGNDLVPSPSSITVTSENTVKTGNGMNNEVEKIDVISNSYPAGIKLNLTEIDDTGMFSGILTLTADDSDESTGKIKVSAGDFLTIGNGKSLSQALVIPNPDPSNGAIQVTVPDDKVTASYLGSSAIITVDNRFGGGGGGGGIVRPTLVLDIVRGLSIFGGGGGSNGNSPPSFGKSSFAIIEGGEEGFGGILNDNDATTLDQTKTFKVGEKAVLRFDFTEGGGIGKIEHIGLYANVRDGQKRQDSDAYIYYDPLKSPQVTVHDPNGLFSEANFELLQKEATKFVLKFDLTFAKPMAKSDLILESWNIKKWSSITKISNAIEVISSGILSETESVPVKTFLEDVTDDKVIPVWVKSNAKWWSAGTIDNENFISGIEYLVNEGIITVSLPEETGDSISEMPSWIKSTAGWWADDMISEDEFVTAIEWLITNNIIQVAA